VGGFAIGSSL